MDSLAVTGWLKRNVHQIFNNNVERATVLASTLRNEV